MTDDSVVISSVQLVQPITRTEHTCDIYILVRAIFVGLKSGREGSRFIVEISDS